MTRRITDEKKQAMQKLYDEGLSVAEISRRADVSYATAYGYTRAKERGFASLYEYRKCLAQERGFASLYEYQEQLAKERQKNPLNQALGDLIQRRLTELGQTQEWLGNQLGRSQSIVSRYISGESRPRRNLQEGLFNALEVPYQTLEDLLENPLGLTH